MYFVKSKIGYSETCDNSYSDHWEMVIKDGGENWYNTNSMDWGEQTTYCVFFWKNMALNGTPYF